MKQKIFCVKTYYENKFFKIVQARYRRKFNFKTFLNKSQIFEMVKNCEAHITFEVWVSDNNPNTQEYHQT